MKRGTKKCYKAQEGKKKNEGVTTKQNKEQKKLKNKQEAAKSESDEIDSDWAEYLKTYDPDEEYSGSNDEKESPRTEESKIEDPKAPESE
ncbi:hypothetical protein A2U01_0056172, partial [Trifolium medium]|nr:hypothetical protein [Trifolium medium]